MPSTLVYLDALPLADRLDRRLFDVVGRVEIRLAGAQPDDVAAGRFERARLVGDGDGRRRFDALELVRKEGHRKSPNLRLPALNVMS